MKFILISSLMFFVGCSTKEVMYNTLQSNFSQKCEQMGNQENCKKNYYEYKEYYENSK